MKPDPKREASESTSRIITPMIWRINRWVEMEKLEKMYGSCNWGEWSLVRPPPIRRRFRRGFKIQSGFEPDNIPRNEEASWFSS